MSLPEYPPGESPAPLTSPLASSAWTPPTEAADGLPPKGTMVDVASPPKLRNLTAADLRTPRRRRRLMPLLLFVATCASTFYVGAMSWLPLMYLGHWELTKQVVRQGAAQGLSYMLALMGILVMHEMGHFLVSLRYHIPASFPMFIPVPVNAIGTMGAVIGMDGMKANRKQMFDMGLSGPIAGLVVALPVLWVGIARLDLSQPVGEVSFHNPLVAQMMMRHLHPELSPTTPIGIRQLNPYFMAGWVGMLITGLNMLPISQLDGGHVVYALFGRRAHRVARAFLVFAIAFVVIEQAYMWSLMLVLVILMGTDHPPTSDDHTPIGPLRQAIGLASLAIPLFCFTPFAIEV